VRQSRVVRAVDTMPAIALVLNSTDTETHYVFVSRVSNIDVSKSRKYVKPVMLRPMVSRPVYLGVKPHLVHKTRFLLLSDSSGFVHVEPPL
jgi:predicted small integral membrane protein